MVVRMPWWMAIALCSSRDRELRGISSSGKRRMAKRQAVEVLPFYGIICQTSVNGLLPRDDSRHLSCLCLQSQQPCIKEANCHPIHFPMPFILQLKSHIKQKRANNTKIIQVRLLYFCCWFRKVLILSCWRFDRERSFTFKCHRTLNQLWSHKSIFVSKVYMNKQITFPLWFD